MYLCKTGYINSRTMFQTCLKKSEPFRFYSQKPFIASRKTNSRREICNTEYLLKLRYNNRVIMLQASASDPETKELDKI